MDDTDKEVAPISDKIVVPISDKVVVPSPDQPALEVVPSTDFSHHNGPYNHSPYYNAPYSDEPYRKITDDTAKSSAESRIAGLRKPTFWLLLALVGVIALAIGLGTGLGYVMNRGNTSKATAASAAAATTSSSAGPTGAPAALSSASPTITSASSVSPITPTSTSSSTSSTSTLVSPCPSGNGTNFAIGESNYLIYCDSNIVGSNKTDDKLIFNSFYECVEVCDKYNVVQGQLDVVTVWNYEGTDTDAPGTCWCEQGTGLSVINNVGNHVAIPISKITARFLS